MDNEKLWVGIDAGKEAHWAHVLDASGKEILSRKVENDEADLAGLIEEVLALCEEAVWAVDQPGTRGSSTSRVSPWSGPATPTPESPTPMPAMPT